MALIFGKIQHERHQLHTFPTLRVTPIGIDFVLYNAQADQLMVICSDWSEQTFFLLWLVLHHNIFKFKTLESKYAHCKSGFVDYVNKTSHMKQGYKYLVSKHNLRGRDWCFNRQRSAP